jgi:hypothetical protein
MDLTVVYRNIQDEVLPTREGTVERFKRVDFFIGKHGPFTERIPLDVNFDLEITRRVAALKASLQNLPT